MNNTIPHGDREWITKTWRFCNSCTGTKRLISGACKNESCPWYPVYSMPRKIELKFDFNEYIPEIVEIAKDSLQQFGKFEMAHVRRIFFSRHGQAKLNWGNIARRKEWLEVFETCGESVSSNERSHGDKVKMWRLRYVSPKDSCIASWGEDLSNV